MIVPVIVLNWNGWTDTLACLRSLRDSADVNQVWLVDNGSATDRSEEASGVYPGLRIMHWDKNYGYAGGYNRALKIAAREGFEFTYLLNNDCTVTPGFLEPLVQTAKNNERLAVVGSRVAYADPDKHLEFDGEHHARGARSFYEGCGTKLVRNVSGAGMLVRLQAMEKHGYFDERFFCYWEETDWCWRMQDHGWLCAVSGDSLVIHKDRGSDKNANAQYYLLRNCFLLLDRVSSQAPAKGKKQIVYLASVLAEEARRSGKTQEWRAIACGLHDGLRGRFGQRPDRASVLIAGLRLAGCSLHAHLRDKWRALQGLPHGYGRFEVE